MRSSAALALLLVCAVLLTTQVRCAEDDNSEGMGGGGSAGTVGQKCSSSSDCAVGFRCACPEAPALTPPSPPPPLVEDYSSPACRSYRTPMGQLVDTAGAVADVARRTAGSTLFSAVSSFLLSGASAASTTSDEAASRGATCKCVAIHQPPSSPPPPAIPPPSPIPPPPSNPPPTVITDANFKSAISTCLDANPVDGLCMLSEYGAMPSWDVSRVTDMSGAFRRTSNFEGNISAWKTSSVVNMSCMFEEAAAFNQTIGMWNTSRVTAMENMFFAASSFAQDVTTWSTLKLSTSNGMFAGATAWLKTYERTDLAKSNATLAAAVLDAGEAAENSTLLAKKTAKTLSDANYTLALADVKEKYARNRTMAETSLNKSGFCQMNFEDLLNETDYKTWFNETSPITGGKSLAEGCACSTPHSSWHEINGQITQVPSTTDCYCYRSEFRASAGTDAGGDLKAKRLACTHTMRWILMEWNRHLNSVLRNRDGPPSKWRPK